MKIFLPGMHEISGFGGAYEEACRKMVLAGVQWLDEHPEAKIAFSSLDGVFGIVKAQNAESQALLDTMVQAGSEPSGAMVHAACDHIFYIKHHGWDAYVIAMSKKETPKD